MTKFVFLMFSRKHFIKIIIFSFCLLLLAPLVKADYTGQQNSFFVEPSYDLSNRSQLNATLILTTSKLYFYVDASWWASLTYADRDTANRNLYYLFHRFEDEDYSVLVKTFGSEAKPGIDNDEHITVLIHSMTANISGYVRSVDLYEQAKKSNSNQREMVYLNSEKILTASASQIGYYLAHEFMHLITLNQKDAAGAATDDVWLNEARAEYISTLLGYDASYSGSNLEQRVNDFWQNPSVSLLDWQNDRYHYAVTDLFAQYLADQYGVKILVDSLHSKLSGIDSINEALKNNGFSEDFSQVFQNWALAVLLNDCNVGVKYCYKNSQLANLRIFPYGYYLPDTGSSNLAVSNNLTSWAGNWLKIVGGKDVLKLDFNFPANIKFSLPYVTADQVGNKTVKFWSDSAGYSGTIIVPSFNTTNVALFLMPIIIENPAAGSSSYVFKWQASTITEAERPQAEKAAEQKMSIFLMSRIKQLKAQLAALLSQLATLQGKPSNPGNLSCGKFYNDLYFGLENNSEVSCLQRFLLSQASDIYPEGLISGNYFGLTKAAVIKYQAKNSLPQTGYFGPLTRSLVNNQLSQ